MTYSNYNELMHKALMIAKERGISQQAELMVIVTEVFKADASSR